MISPHRAVHPSHPTNPYGATFMMSSSTTDPVPPCQGELRVNLWFLPLVRRVKLHRQHVQGVPGGDADSPKQAEQSNHGGLAVAKGQEETADARNHTGARWREREVGRERERGMETGRRSCVNYELTSALMQTAAAGSCMNFYTRFPGPRVLLLPSILRRPILSMSSAETMLPGNTAKVPRKLTK